MSPSVAFECIVTPEEVEQAATGGERVDAADGHVARLCEAATREIEGYLGRRLIVHVATAAPRWDRSSLGYAAYLDAWPMLDVPTGWIASGQHVLADRLPARPPVVYHAGYRREDMALEDVQAHYPALTALPPLLPEDIRELAVDHVLYHLAARAQGVGVQDVEIDAGAATVRRRSVRAAWWEENRGRIQHHRLITL